MSPHPKCLALPRRLAVSTLSLVAWGAIALGACRDDAVGADQAPTAPHSSLSAVPSAGTAQRGQAVPLLQPVAAAPTTTAASPFTFYQFEKAKFYMAPGVTSGSAIAYCPVGTQVVGGGMALVYELTDYPWIELSYPFYNPATQQYGWQIVAARAAGSPNNDSLLAAAICVN